MINIYNMKNQNATVCAGKVCATVHGDAAKIVNAIVIAAVLITAVAVVLKAVK